MKLRIKIKRFKNAEGEPLVSLPKVIKKGDWVDLSTAKEVTLNAPQAGTLKGHDVKHRDVISEVTYIPLGIAMQLPEGYVFGNQLPTTVKAITEITIIPIK